jgi:hypothetical protein
MSKINESNAGGIRAVLDILNESGIDPVAGAQQMDFGVDPDSFDDTDDAAIDRWHDGALDAMHGKKATSGDKDYLEGYKHGQEEAKVQVAEPERPEGYYHAPLGTFESDEVEEAGMPSSVIKAKQRLALMTDEELAERYKGMATERGKSAEELARQDAWRHGYGEMSPHYWNRIKAHMDVEEAAEHDFRLNDVEAEEYGHAASMPGKASAQVRYTPARQSDNPMVEDISLEKSFLDYLKEAQDKEDSAEEDESEN